MQRYTGYFIWKLLYMFRVIPSPTIRSANNCIYSIWYFLHRYCYLLLSWKSWNWFECAVAGVGGGGEGGGGGKEEEGSRIAGRSEDRIPAGGEIFRSPPERP